MTLVIEYASALALVETLATKLEISAEEAVRIAVAERLALESRIEKVLEIGRDCARRLSAPTSSLDHGTVLYGPDGLPQS